MQLGQLLLAMLGAMASGSSVVPSYDVEISDEYNESPGAHYLSDKSSGMPEVLMSITATTLLGADPLSSQEVVFTCTDSGYLAPATGSWPVTVQTDSNGQATIQVKGTGQGGGNEVEVHANWEKAGTNWTASVTIELRSESQTNHDTPQSHNALSNPGSIKYSDSTTFMSTATASARSTWANTGRVGFSSGTPLQITFGEYFDQAGPLGVTDNSGYPRTIRFNSYQLNSNPSQNPWGMFPPAAARHDLAVTANHELGHALGLSHNSHTKYALMYGSVYNYFVWKVEAVVEGERDTFNWMYPPL